ncbi:carbohydrate ABC transporter permease, partial [Candidatus Omnitrophota bacterium]
HPFQSIKKHRFQILLLLPLASFLAIFTLTPIIRVIILSFQSIATTTAAPQLTLTHYQDLFTQPAFKQAFLNTLIIAGVSLALEISLGLILALLLSKNLKLIRFLRPIFILPLAIPTAVVGVVMSYLFATSGWINRMLTDLNLISSPINWMQGGINSLFMLTLADCWKVTPLVMLILLAGLQSIDKSLYKAARIDGAGTFHIFRRITLPLLMPAITAAVIIRGIDAFRIFALPLILMGQNLKVIGTYAYLEYTEFSNPYASAASSVILLVMILLAVALYIKAVGKKGIAVG